ncbi:MAG TPA: hypothetical protein VEC14_10255, partial [Reyranellaceae bacterium]|nr:hypothetical protein [Reyranellaceae bacterium]
MTDSLLAPEPDAPANDTPLPAAGSAPDTGAPPPESGAGDAAAEAAQPVTYEPFTLPEGLAVDQATLAEAQTLFAEAKLSQPQAQKLVDLYTSKFGGL